MKHFRVLMMLGALLATAGAANAQPTQLFDRLIDLPDTCPAQTWYMQAWQDGANAWMRVRALCATSAQTSKCCEAGAVKAGTAPTLTTVKAGDACCLRVLADTILGSVMSCEAVQSKSCACAKACACCETCKATKKEAPRVQALTPEMLRQYIAARGDARIQPLAITCPPAPVCMPPVQGSGIVQILPVPSAPVVQVVHVANHARPARFMTPEFEAHCERMHHQGDSVILEGNVLLLCKKHAQPIRIEAQRVIVNMRTGSFTVESDTRVVPATSFGIQRTSAVQTLTPGTALSPFLRAVPAPTQATPPMEREQIFNFFMQLHR